MDTFNTEYQLQSITTGNLFEDTGWLLDEPGASTGGLIRAVYKNNTLKLREESCGLFKFADWLPLRGQLSGSSAPYSYKSQGLAHKLGLNNLWITFSGFWPEKGVLMSTCSFKETEAYSVCSRLNGYRGKTLVVASAGNTARAFARVCSENNINLVLCVPYDYCNALWFDKPLAPCVKLIATPIGSDYFDAIHLSNMIAQLEGYTAEGGAKNVARRDGMGTTVLSAVSAIGTIPDFYFQAVGSGTGAIAAWEANIRLIADGRFGDKKMKLMVSQNDPFLPIYDAWKAGSRALLPFDDHQVRESTQQIDAKVLSNRRPPYSLSGGLFDALTDTGGDVMKVTNDELWNASSIFEETEGIDIHPAAAVATASLIQAAKEGTVKPDDLIMLNITGGGENRFKSTCDLYYLKPHIVLNSLATFDEIKEAVETMYL